MATKTTFFLIATLVLFNCVNTTIDIKKELQKPVVSGYLYTTKTTQSIRVTSQCALDSAMSSAKPIQTAEVFLTSQGSDAKIAFAYDTLKKTYTAAFTPEQSKLYNLTVRCNDLTMTGYTIVPEKPILAITPETLVVDTGLEMSEVMQNPTNYPKFSLVIGNDKMNFHTLRVENREPQKKTFFKNVNPNMLQNQMRRGVTFQGGKMDVTMRRFAFLGRTVITVQRINDIYVNFMKSSQNQGGPGDDEINVEEMTIAPSNIDQGLGIFSSFATDSIVVFVKARE